MLYFATVLIALAILLYIMPVTVSTTLEKAGEKDKITIGVKTLYGLVKFKSEIPFLELVFMKGKPALKYRVEVTDRKRSRLFAQFTKLFSLDEGGKLLEIIRKKKHRLLAALKYLAGKTAVRKFSLRFALGTGDAAETGILYGVAWIIIGNIMAITGSYLNIKEPRITVVPVFNQVQLSADFNCIISIRLGHIINTGIRIIPVLLSGIGKRNLN